MIYYHSLLIKTTRGERRFAMRNYTIINKYCNSVLFGVQPILPHIMSWSRPSISVFIVVLVVVIQMFMQNEFFVN